MARRQYLARWAAALCLMTAGTVHFAAQAEALEAQVGVQVPPLLLPGTLPTQLAITLSLPSLWEPASQPAQPISDTADPSQAQVVPGPTPPASPALAPAQESPVTPLPPAPGTPAATTVPPPPTTVPPPCQGCPPTPPHPIPLALIAALTGFLAVQAFIDRRDPKLAVAPVGDEMFGFR